MVKRIQEAAKLVRTIGCGAQQKKGNRILASWITSELFGRLAAKGKSVEESPVTPAQLSSIVHLVREDTITGSVGKQVLDLMTAGDSRLATEIVQERGWQTTKDYSFLEQLVREVLEPLGILPTRRQAQSEASLLVVMVMRPGCVQVS